MPDAYGNLLNINEFTTGLKVRFISYLGPSFAMAVSDEAQPFSSVTLRDLTLDPLQMGYGASVFTLESKPGAFRAKTTMWDGATRHLGMVTLAPGYIDMQGLTDEQTASGWYAGDDILNFTGDWVDGCWFAFNNHDRTRVADVRESVADDGTPILGFKWNGGDNQRWRACIATD